ncbi:uncharacterized protein [Oryza sativa Japonica Group]|nr:uncharacterized protein LOC9271320 [Oryza sativa Japonica Group]KAF2937192.1 hypothetical protein DAI22_03g032100 [Oryza sativa Japonica Group]
MRITQRRLSTGNRSPAATHECRMLPLAAGAGAARPCLSSSPAPPVSSPGAIPLLRHTPIPHHRRRPLAALRTRIMLLRPLRAAASPGPAASSRPARDRVIDFGKHKGQMLGTLPPSYLRWVVAELDYGDTAAWASLAREVLDDPVYVDRVEWEHAHRFLRGDTDYDGDGEDGPLHEMADRFGWDLSDEEGWSRLDFRLLGTSYGGRIPRKGGRRQTTTSSLFDIGAETDGPRGKRDERRERMRLRRETQVRGAKLDMLGVNAGVKDGGVLGTPRKARTRTTAKTDILGLGRRRSRGGEVLGEKVLPGSGGQGGNPFPGRQAFLDKVRKLKDDS